MNKGRGFGFLLIIIFLITLNFVNATTYYVSNSGSDSNSGLSTQSTWSSLSKLNSFTLFPGDKILFKRGDSWHGTISPTSSGILNNQIFYGAYGNGDNPKIYGTEEITGWSKYSGNIYKATFNSDMTQLFLDDKKMKVARSPNSGYHLIDSVENSIKFISNSLNSNINYVGANWIGRTNNWLLRTRNIISSNQKALTLDKAPYADIDIGEGFILTNKLELLDSPGEWYYDGGSNTIYLWAPLSDNPSSHVITGSIYENGFEIKSKKYITVDNFNLFHQADIGILVDNGENIKVTNNNISYAERIGIDIKRSGYPKNNEIINNTIEGASKDGIYSFSSDSIIMNNIIKHTFAFDEIGIIYDMANARSSLYSIGDNVKISYNRILDSGYIGINFNGINNIIEYNFIDGGTQVLDDGGGIYSWQGSYNIPGSSGSIIRNNIVLNMLGNRDGAPLNNYGAGSCIYMDNDNHDVTIENNYLAYCGLSGIFLHVNGKINVKNNMVFDSSLAMLLRGEHEDNTITNNIFYSTSKYVSFGWRKNVPESFILQIEGANSIFDYNKYINHYFTNDIFVNYPTFDAWKSSTSQDSHSTFDSSSLLSGESEKFFYNDLRVPKSIDLKGNIYKDAKDNTISGTLILQPFTATILIGKNLDNIFGESIIPINNTQNNNYCGDGIIGESESCDDGSLNGVICNSFCDSACYYCSSSCISSINVGNECMQNSEFFSLYSFEEDSGNLISDSILSNNGILFNEELRTKGVNGNGLKFTGKGYVNLGEVFGNVKNEVTLSSWIKLDNSTGYRGVIMHGGVVYDTFALYVDYTSNLIGFKTSGTSSPWMEVEINNLSDGKWHYLTATYNGIKKIIYLDGLVVDSINANGSIESGVGYNCYIGAGRDEASPTLLYSGEIDEVRIYNYSLTESEINTLYKFTESNVNDSLNSSSSGGSSDSSSSGGSSGSSSSGSELIKNRRNNDSDFFENLKIKENKSKEFINGEKMQVEFINLVKKKHTIKEIIQRYFGNKSMNQINESIIVSNETHHIIIDEVKNNFAIITIKSNPQKIKLEINEDKNIELNGDNNFDLNIRLNSINNGVANITVSHIFIKMTPEEKKESDRLKNLNIKYLGYFILFIFIIFILISIIYIILNLKYIYFKKSKHLN